MVDVAWDNHYSRVVCMFVFLLFFVAIVEVLFGVILQWLFNYNINGDTLFVGVIFSMLFCWASNVRFGWLENLIIGKREYPLFMIWFERV